MWKRFLYIARSLPPDGKLPYFNRSELAGGT
jgi:hypothetical protein